MTMAYEQHNGLMEPERFNLGREESDIVAVSDGVIASQLRAEIDMQVSTAKRYRRSVTSSIQNAIGMATIDLETAATCFYKVPRGGKMIEGPSVRLAEIFCSAWGNMRFAARVVSEDDRFVTAQGTAHDLETNNATMIEVRRRITDKNGRKFNDDMIAVTGNAAASIALRNAVFRVIPRSYVDQVWRQAKRVAIGDAKTLTDRRSALIGHIVGKIGIPLARVLNAVGRTREEDVDLNNLETLYGLATAVKDGEIEPDAAFPEVQAIGAPPVADPGKSKAGQLADKLKKPAAAPQAAAPVEHSSQVTTVAAEPKADPAPVTQEQVTANVEASSTALSEPEKEDIKTREWLEGSWKTIEREMRHHFITAGLGVPADFVKLSKEILGIVPEKSTLDDRMKLWNHIQGMKSTPE